MQSKPNSDAIYVEVNEITKKPTENLNEAKSPENQQN